MTKTLLALALSLVMACTSAGATDAPSSGNAAQGQAGADGSSGGGDGAGGAQAGGTVGAGGSVIAGGGAGGGTTLGCNGVDVLFVIDSSASMADNQKSLIKSFPGFVAAMRQKLANAPSFHVGVVTTDDHYQNPKGCQQIGDLITQNSGVNSSNAVCTPFASAKAYLSDADADLEQRFACAAQIGNTGSDDERPMRALLNALKPEKYAPGGCNEGFARPDTLLVLVVITDEDDVPDGCDGSGGCMSYGSGGTPQEWFDELLSYRGGRPENVVALSLVGRTADNPCGAVVNSKIFSFTRRFGDNGFAGDICADSYDGFFNDAVPLVATACANYVPIK